MNINIGLDEYSRNARLKPALLTVLPAVLTIAAWSPSEVLGWSGFWSLFVASGGTWLLAQVARDRGKRKEKELFASQGGRPTERLLSHAGAPNKVTLARRHAKLAQLVPEIIPPSADDEAKNPLAAQEVYAAWTGYLIAHTRDDRLVLQENINFGFRRNLWGLKPYGLVIAIGTTIILGLQLLGDVLSHSAVQPLTVIAVLFDVAMVVVWLSVVRPGWVMIPGWAYAERLMEAIDRLSTPEAS